MTGSKILEGPQPKRVVPEKTLGQLFFDSATKNADKICQIDSTTGETETYGSVKTRSTRVALELQKRGITSNDVVVFCTRNTIDAAIPLLGSLYVGAKIASLDPSLSTRQTQHLISLSQPKIIFVEEESVGLIEESLQAAGSPAEIIVYGKSGKYATLGHLTQPKQGEEEFQPVTLDVHETALMLFSSGTTGMPKAICHSHFSFIHIGCTLSDLDFGNVVMHFTTFYWQTAFIMLTVSHITGGSRVFCRSFDPEVALKAIEKYRVTTSFMVPTLAHQLTRVENATNYDTSSLRQLHCGGTAVTPAQFQELTEFFTHSAVLNVYGQSECGYISCFYHKTDEKFIKSKKTSSGKPVFGMRVKIVNEETEEVLGPNQTGEICAQTLSRMVGYYNADCSDVFTEDGFVRTGDMGYYDEDGCLYVTGRIKEMFKYQSWHIVPSALEAVLQEHPSVREAAVFGVPFGDDGEAPGACVVLKDGHNVSETEIFDFVAQKMTDREKLRGGIKFVNSLPKTPTGKLMRKEVRKLVVNTA